MNAGQHDKGPNSSQGEYSPGYQAAGGLMADVLAGVMRLVQGELALFRAEARQRAQAAQSALLLIVFAVVLGLTALNVLAGALITGVVALGLAPHWATLLVGVLLALVAAALARGAIAHINCATTGAVRTAQSVRRDIETLQAMVKQDA